MRFSVGPTHYSWDPQVLYLAKKTSKLSLTILFTHLKIILLQYFQFSVISGIQTHPKSEVSFSYNSFLIQVLGAI